MERDRFPSCCGENFPCQQSPELTGTIIINEKPNIAPVARAMILYKSSIGEEYGSLP